MVVSGSRGGAPERRAAESQPAQARSTSAAPKPGLFAPKGEKHLYEILTRTGLGSAGYAARCTEIAAKFPKQRIAALTLA